MSEFNNVNFYLTRTDYQQPFVLNGRVNDLESSMIKDKEIKDTLNKHKIEFSVVNGNTSEEKTNKIYEIILNTLKLK